MERGESRISRRSFMKGAVLGAGITAMAGIEPKNAPAAKPPRNWQMEADVVVVGFGGAGACAAIEAHDAGARVVLLEKAPSDFPGGNTGCNAGFLLPPSNEEDGFMYHKALGSGTVADDELIRTFVKGVMAVPEWLKGLGVPIKVLYRNRPGSFPKLPGSKVDWFIVPGGGGNAFNVLQSEVERRKIQVFHETPVKALIQDPESGSVLGVTAEFQGKIAAVKAGRGVVLACGGYENNPVLMGNLNVPGIRFYPYGSPYNTGDGLLMTMAAGAAQWHFPILEVMNYTVKAVSEELKLGVPLRNFWKGGSFLFVNGYGRRFTNESRVFGHYKGPIETTFLDHAAGKFENVPFFMIFDETMRKHGGAIVPKYLGLRQTVGWAFQHKLFQEWSKDNSREIEKGWIKKADTPADLAGLLGIDPKGLSKTIVDFNKFQAAGKDPDFERSAKTLQPLVTPPFYGLELAHCVVNTQGGPVHDACARVIDTNGRAIPRLYAAGELGSIFGHLYQGGSNFPEAIAFGRIAGKEAASLKPWA
jgi:succinate dehydrogenase/fumarate reductase flavoprotein subunit